MEYKVVCGCIIRSTPRLQKSNQRNIDILKRSGPVTIKEAKPNTRSSTEAELVGADDVTTQILWTKHFRKHKDT